MEELIGPCGPRLWRLCLRLAGDRAEAEELYQQTFLRALECESRLKREENPGAWLCATAVGLHKSASRRAARRNALAPCVREEELETLPAGENPEEAVLRMERAERVNALMGGLPEKYRAPLLLYYAGGLSVEEISRALHIPTGTVKSRLGRARARIREGWEGWNDDRP